MSEEAHDAEEVVLFPDHALAIASDHGVNHGPRSSHELLAAMANTSSPVGLREWLTVQLSQVDAQIRKQKATPHPVGLTPELAAYVQAKEAQAGRKAMRDAYTKALNKLDHFARSDA